MTVRKLIAIAGVAILLTGCTAAKNLFKGNDDTVLSGQRESVLPPEQQTARDPVVTGDQAPDPQNSVTPCKQDDPTCVTPIDQEAGSTGGQ